MCVLIHNSVSQRQLEEHAEQPCIFAVRGHSLRLEPAQTQVSSEMMRSKTFFIGQINSPNYSKRSVASKSSNPSITSVHNKRVLQKERTFIILKTRLENLSHQGGKMRNSCRY